MEPVKIFVEDIIGFGDYSVYVAYLLVIVLGSLMVTVVVLLLWLMCKCCRCVLPLEVTPSVILSPVHPRSLPSENYRAAVNPMVFSYGYHNALARHRQNLQFENVLTNYNLAPGNIDALRDQLNVVRNDYNARVPENISGLSNLDIRDKLTDMKHSDYHHHRFRIFENPHIECQRLLYDGASLPDVEDNCCAPQRVVKLPWILPSPFEDRVEVVHLPTCRKLADDMSTSLRSAWGSFFIKGPRKYSPAEHSYYFGYHCFQNVTVQIKDQGAFQKNGCNNAATVEVAILIWMQANNIPMPFMSLLNHLTPRQADIDHSVAAEYFRSHSSSQDQRRPYVETYFLPSTVGLGLGVHSSSLLVYQDPSQPRTSAH